MSISIAPTSPVVNHNAGRIHDNCKELDRLIYGAYTARILKESLYDSEKLRQSLCSLEALRLSIARSDPLYPLVEKVEEVVRESIRGKRSVDRFMFLYPKKNSSLPKTLLDRLRKTDFFESSFQERGPCLLSLQEIVWSSPFYQDMEAVVRVLEEVVACLSGYKNAPDFSFMNLSDSKDVRLLFKVVNYFGLENFQHQHLEPFNRNFPKISLDEIPPTARLLYFGFNDEPSLFSLSTPKIKIPPTIKVLILDGYEGKYFDFSCLRDVETVELYWTWTSPEQIRQFPSTLKKLRISEQPLTPLDFSHLIQLEELNLEMARDVQPIQITWSASTLKVLNLSCIDVHNFNFSGLKALEQLDLSNASNVTAEQIKQFPSTLKVLNLSYVDVRDFDFSSLKALEKLDLSNASNVTAEQIKQFPSTLWFLDLSQFPWLPWLIGARQLDEGVDFSHLTRLKILKLNNVGNVKEEQIKQLPSDLEKLYLKNVNVNNISFSHLPKAEIVLE